MDHNLTSVSTEVDSYSQHYDKYFIVDWIVLLLTIVSFGADIYLIVIIKKFKTLQTDANLIVLKTLWCHLAHLTLGNVIYIFLVIISSSIHSTGLCLVRNLDYLCLSMVYFMLTFLALDWFMVNYHPNYHQRHSKIFKRSLLVSFVLLLPETLVTSAVCIFNEQSIDLVQRIIKNISFFLCFIILMTLLINKKGKPETLKAIKNKYCFSVPWVFFLMCLPIHIDSWFHDIYMKHVNDIVLKTILIVLGDVTLISFTLAPIVMVFLLATTNKHFRIAHIRCCKKKRVKTYTDEDLDDAGSENEDGRSPVSFAKDLESVQF